MSSAIPSAKDMVVKAVQKNPKVDVNTLHEKTYRLMLSFKSKYYKKKVDAFLSTLKISEKDKMKVKKGLLKPVIVDDVRYNNIMEEASRRISQSFQPLSGQIAELCAERELIKFGLKKDIHYTKRKKRTDLIVYYPDIKNVKAEHRVEVKNVKLRERGVRGLVFDGDSLFGFFNSPAEFTQNTVEIIEKTCKSTGGYCYIPPLTLSKIPHKSRRLRLNTVFGQDMRRFVKSGKLP
ncbi:MAG: hypothetical protein QMC80_01290 [Thermoplasmatales archaeon]|nr:hypothetical protein [Thermoplasmatales archaeon]